MDYCNQWGSCLHLVSDLMNLIDFDSKDNKAPAGGTDKQMNKMIQRGTVPLALIFFRVGSPVPTFSLHQSNMHTTDTKQLTLNKHPASPTPVAAGLPAAGVAATWLAAGAVGCRGTGGSISWCSNDHLSLQLLLQLLPLLQLSIAATVPPPVCVGCWPAAWSVQGDLRSPFFATFICPICRRFYDAAFGWVCHCSC